MCFRTKHLVAYWDDIMNHSYHSIYHRYIKGPFWQSVCDNVPKWTQSLWHLHPVTSLYL